MAETPKLWIPAAAAAIVIFIAVIITITVLCAATPNSFTQSPGPLPTMPPVVAETGTLEIRLDMAPMRDLEQEPCKCYTQ
ncbi:MAG: hypothetical protein HQ553_13320 [Chloroflexi bacterium]|nr:hypothetical protein [Chloroflexota bacterium]